MREIRTSGSEGGARSIPCSYLYPHPMARDSIKPGAVNTGRKFRIGEDTRVVARAGPAPEKIVSIPR